MSTDITWQATVEPIAGQEAIDFHAVSEPISGDTRATVELVGDDWLGEDDWQRFKAAVRIVAALEQGVVDPNEVRTMLTDDHGQLMIEPRRYSALWHRASRGRDAFLVADGWVTNTDHAGRNAGKPLRRYRLQESA